MALRIDAASHLDHFSAEHRQKVADLLTERFADRSSFFTETVELPIALDCALYGPAAGDPPIKRDDPRLYVAAREVR